MSNEKTFTCFALTECFENAEFSPYGKQSAPFYDALKGQGKIAFRVGNSISGRVNSMNGDKNKFHSWIVEFQSTPTEIVTVGGKPTAIAIPMTEKQIAQWVIENPDKVSPLWANDERCITALNEVLTGTKKFKSSTSKVKPPSISNEAIDLLNALLAQGFTAESIATMTIDDAKSKVKSK